MRKRISEIQTKVVEIIFLISKKGIDWRVTKEEKAVQVRGQLDVQDEIEIKSNSEVFKYDDCEKRCH